MHFCAKIQRHHVPLGIAAEQFGNLSLGGRAWNQLKAVLANRTIEVSQIALVLIDFFDNHRFAIGAGHCHFGAGFDCLNFLLRLHRVEDLDGPIRPRLGGFGRESGECNRQNYYR